jgi:hypothetical protein
MISITSTAIVAVLAALSFSSVVNAEPSETKSKTAIDAVASKDSFLRSALASIDKSEQQVREKFSKELAALNEARLKALQQAFDRASGRRDTESVASLAAIINDMKGEGAAKSLGAKPDEISPIGNWEFKYNGQSRRFRFAEDKSFQGQLAVSGKDIAGTWERSKDGIVLKRPEEKEDVFATISMADGKDAKLLQFNGYAMSGRKTE